MKIIKYDYTDINGTAHVACFMSWCGVQYGYPAKAAAGMCEWVKDQPVWCDIGGFTDTDQSQRQ